jgi:protein-S-isoprenylcysteine O-methyltransferase Ste14
MSAPGIVVILWVLFYAYWMIAAVGVKRNVRTQGQTERWGLRLLVIAGIIFLLRVPGLRQALLHYQTAHVGPTTELVGFLLCVCGFAFAIWARLHLGRNWGQPMTLKQGHELVTTGPYRFVRHPIYTGILLAMLGSTIVTPFWIVAFICLTGYFVYSAHTEERIMTSQFPDQYPEYKRRTKMLVPLVW